MDLPHVNLPAIIPCQRHVQQRHQGKFFSNEKPLYFMMEVQCCRKKEGCEEICCQIVYYKIGVFKTDRQTPLF